MKTRWQDWINIVLGGWLIVSTWELDYAHMTEAAWNGYLVGFAVMVIAAAALTSPSSRKELANMGLGLWLISSPWLLHTHHHAAAAANTFIVGLVIVVVTASTFWPHEHGSNPPAHV